MNKTVKVTSEPALSRAFTLVELLFAVSIMSLLFGLLVPTFRRARAVAKQTVCQSQLRQWGLAFETYAMENDGFYPHIDGLDRNNGPADRFGWVDMVPPLMGEKPWRNYNYWHKPGINTVFQCPSARLAPDKCYTHRPRRTGYFSYAMNSCLELDRNCWPPHGCTGGDWHMPSSTSRMHRWRLAHAQLFENDIYQESKSFDLTV